MNKIPAILPKDVEVLVDIECGDFSKFAAIEHRMSFFHDLLMRSLLFNKFTTHDFEMNLAEQARLRDHSLFLLKEIADDNQSFVNIWRTPSITDRFHAELMKVFNGTNVDKDSAIGTTFELLLAASTSKLFTSSNVELASEHYVFDSNVFLQFNYIKGELASAHFWRNNRFLDVDISFVKLKPVFAALGKVYKPSILTFDGPLRNYYSDKRTEANQ